MNWIGVALTALALLVLFAATEWLRRRGVPTDVTRSGAHVIGGGFAASFPLYLGLGDVLLIGGVVTALLATTAFRGGLPSIHAVERPTIGAVALPVGGMLAALLVWPTPAAFSYAVLVLAVADPAAAAIGRQVRGPRWPAVGGVKSVAGSAAFFLVALVITAALGGPGIAAVSVAVALTVIEGLLGYGLDDLAIPVAAGVLARAFLL
jgi:phytol kinase